MVVNSADDFNEANVALEVIKERSTAIFQRSEALRSLGTKLERHTERWVSEQRTLDEQHEALCAELVSSLEAEMVKLQTQLHDFSAVRSNNESEELDFAQEMDDIKERISTLEQKRDVFPGEQSVLQQEIDSRNERLGMRRAQLEQLKRRNKRKETKLVEQYNCYRKAFGLHVRTLDATTMEFAFKHIDKRDPDATFNVAVSIEGANYCAKSCTPMISNFDELAERLQRNGESDLKFFLRDVRKAFRELIE